MSHHEPHTPPVHPVAHEEGPGPWREVHFGRLGVPMVTDSSLLEPLAGEWSDVVLRIMQASPEHWECLTLLLVGLNTQIQTLSRQVQQLLREANDADDGES